MPAAGLALMCLGFGALVAGVSHTTFPAASYYPLLEAGVARIDNALRASPSGLPSRSHLIRNDVDVLLQSQRSAKLQAAVFLTKAMPFRDASFSGAVAFMTGIVFA